MLETGVWILVDWHDSACAAASIYKAYNIETIAINTDKKRLDKK